MKSKSLITIILLWSITLSLPARSLLLNLDSCRILALRDNKKLQISKEKVIAARYEQKAAFTNYLPNFSAMGAYLHNSRSISLLSDENKEMLGSMGTTAQNAAGKTLQQLILENPSLGTLLAPLAGVDIATPLNAFGTQIVDAFSTDTRNVYVGTVSVVQPIYMGGKIRAYDKITRYARQIAASQQNTAMQEVILSTDEAYWQVVSLSNKRKLAQSYLALLQRLDEDLNKMIAAGVATKADELSVRVKLNEAEMTLLQTENGLSLSKMVLCQLCGIEIGTHITLTDEEMDNLPPAAAPVQTDVRQAIEQRPEIQSLTSAAQIYRQKINITRAEFLPHLALTGNYIISNPSVFNGFETKFGGMWNVGLTLQIPLWHWGEGIYKVKAAKAQANIAEYTLSDTKEKITLQVNQCQQKVNEASARLAMALKNMEKAEENLRYARLGFQEGVIPTGNLLEAQTAWLQAHSSKIDAQIDIKITESSLLKAMGQLR